MIKKYFLSLFLAIAAIPVFSQACDQMFTSVKTPGGIVIVGEIPGDTYTIPAIPVVTMVAPNGDTLWRTEDTISPYLNISYMTVPYFDADFVYVRIQVNEDHQNSPSQTQIWKLSLQTGDVIWKSALYPSDGDETADIRNYSADQFLFYYGIRDNNGGTIAGYRIFMMNKSDGAVTQINEYVGSLSAFKPILDQNNNLLIGYRLPGSESHAYIRKISGLDFDNIIWEKQFNHGVNVASLDDIDQLLVDKFNHLYASGSGDIFRINTDTGAEVWSIGSATNGNYMTDFQFFDNFLYVSSAHSNVGSVSTQFRVNKINTDTGAMLWTSFDAQMTPVGEPIPMTTGDLQAALSFDVDCQGDVFATGYYASANYSPAAWGIMKISAQTGLKIADLTVTNNPVTLNTLSCGLSAYVYDGDPVFIGNLQYSADDAVRVFVKTDNALSTVETKVYQCIVDSDNDSVADWDEDVNGINFLTDDNTDGTGWPNYLDSDDDGDGIPTALEDGNGDGDPTNDFSDPLHPNLPNYLNPAIALSLDEYRLAFAIYPNPTSGILNIEASGQEIQSAKVFTAIGTEVVSCDGNCNTIDISHLSAGIYFITVSTGENAVTRKIVRK